MNKISLLLIWATGFVLATNIAIKADDIIKSPIGVVELFTSQSCSSCPPADKILAKLIEEDVLALSYHVDYWNYLGWKDTLGSKFSTDRQYAYAKSLNRRSVYTPQVIINGRDHLAGNNYSAIKTRITKFAKTKRGLSVPVTISPDANKLNIAIGSGKGKANIIMVYFNNTDIVDIKRGENQGKNLTYHHSVRAFHTIGMWDGKAQNITLPRPTPSMINAKRGGYAVLVQTMTDADTPTAIIGAASYKYR